MPRTAVVLFNLGGPDSLEAVRPFLRNLFSDPAIVRTSAPVRWLLAWLISWRRAPSARENYRIMGGRSPLIRETEAQARALEERLGLEEARVFVCMRYWHPMAKEVVEAVRSYDPDQLVLLPLYPQFSSSTTASSLRQWNDLAEARLPSRSSRICCYPEEPGFVDTIARAIMERLASWDDTPLRILYSAHGLPKTFVDQGDPYQSHVERTVAAVRARLDREDLDHVICYQSRVGRLEWIGPYTDAEVRRAGEEGRGLIVVPVAFVSEHIETLVELDDEYRRLAEEAGVPRYERVATVGTAAAFIEGLAKLVRNAVTSSPGVLPPDGVRICQARFRDCPAAMGS